MVRSRGKREEVPLMNVENKVASLLQWRNEKHNLAAAPVAICLKVSDSSDATAPELKVKPIVAAPAVYIDFSYPFCSEFNILFFI